MRLRREATLLVAVAVAWGLGACGGGSDDEEQVRATLTKMQRATASRDYQTLCDDVFARRLVAKLRTVGLPCEVALQLGLRGVRQPTLVIQKVTVKGKAAEALVRSAARGQSLSQDVVRLVKEDGNWRVSTLAAPAQRRAPVPREVR